MNVEQGKPADAGDKRIKMTMVPVTPDNMIQAAQAISQWLQLQIAAAGGMPADKVQSGSGIDTQTILLALLAFMALGGGAASRRRK